MRKQQLLKLAGSGQGRAVYGLPRNQDQLSQIALRLANHSPGIRDGLGGIDNLLFKGRCLLLNRLDIPERLGNYAFEQTRNRLQTSRDDGAAGIESKLAVGLDVD